MKYSDIWRQLAMTKSRNLFGYYTALPHAKTGAAAHTLAIARTWARCNFLIRNFLLSALTTEANTRE